MNEITNIALDNEMDLILAHKQSMRLCELAGLSLSAQTTFATAVSELSRNAIGEKNEACLKLFVSDKTERIKFIIAVLSDKRIGFSQLKDEGYNYAKRLAPNIQTNNGPDVNQTELRYRLPIGYRIDSQIVEKWRISLNADPAVSPYEEIKRKNRQLLEMAEKLRESERQYISLTNSLPIMIFSLSKDGNITYANQWLQDYTGHTIADINTNQWKDIVHPDDFDQTWENWQQKSLSGDSVAAPERRLKDTKSGEYRWHTGASIPMTKEDGSVESWNNFMVDIHAQKLIEETLKDNVQLKEVKAELEEKVKQLNQSNLQLEQFAYVASHDLQEPLRKISFYSDFLKKKYGHNLHGDVEMLFNNLINATDRMRALILDILSYSTIRPNEFSSIDLNKIGDEILQDIQITIKEKQANIIIGDLPVIEGNERQIKQLFENLISNSLKFSRHDVPPSISITAEVNNNEVILRFLDNGIGFEQIYMGKMFDLFQRLHTRDKYSGTGIGLAICKKIVLLHNGDIIANGEPDNGATFLITLPIKQLEIRRN